MSPAHAKVTAEQVVAAYRETGSVWKAAKRLGIAGQSVHERLRAIGYPIGGREWGDEEVDELRTLLEAGLPMSEIAQRLGRPFAGVANKASRLGLRTCSKRERKLPRGAGFDKASTRRHMANLEHYDGPVTRYARTQGVLLETLVQALQRHVPERWGAYVAEHSDIPQRECPYCGVTFIPSSGKQRYHSRKCASDARRDHAYFNGNRANTIGLAEGICQLCGREGVSGLSAHHMIGREHDLEGSLLIALCRGCHQIVSTLAGRTRADDPFFWETLVQLVWLRRHGHSMNDGDAIYACVEFEIEAQVEAETP